MGAGAIVTKDVELATVVVGNPARVICKTDKVIDNITGKKFIHGSIHLTGNALAGNRIRYLGKRKCRIRL